MVEPLEIRALLAADGLSAGASSGEDSPLLLAAEGETTPIVEYVVRTLAPGTMTPITSILAGREFDLELRVRDLRNDGNKSRGVFAAYVDLLYDKSLAKVRVPEIQSITNVGALTGSFTLTYGSGLKTAPIVFDLESVDGAAAFPASSARSQSGVSEEIGDSSTLFSESLNPPPSVDIECNQSCASAEGGTSNENGCADGCGF